MGHLTFFFFFYFSVFFFFFCFIFFLFFFVFYFFFFLSFFFANTMFAHTYTYASFYYVKKPNNSIIYERLKLFTAFASRCISANCYYKFITVFGAFPALALMHLYIYMYIWRIYYDLCLLIILCIHLHYAVHE